MSRKLTLVSNQPVPRVPAVSADTVQTITTVAMQRLFIKDDASLIGLLVDGNNLPSSNRQMLARWIEAYLNDSDHSIQPVEPEILYDDLHKALLLAWWDWNDVAPEAPGGVGTDYPSEKEAIGCLFALLWFDNSDHQPLSKAYR